MKNQVNLMSRGARVKSIVRTRLYQWAIAYACIVILLVPLLLMAWWPVHQESQKVDSLSAQCEPIRELKKSSRSFRQADTSDPCSRTC